MKAKLVIAMIALFLLGVSGTLKAENENRTEEGQYLRAVQLFNQHDWPAARKCFKDFQLAFPRSRWKTAVQLRLADLEDDPAVAENAYTAVLEAANDAEWGQDARWALANTMFTQAKYLDASRHFLIISQSGDPRRSRALFQAGACQLALKDYKAAKEFFCRLVEQDSESSWGAQARISLGDTEMELCNYATALSAYDEYLGKYPEGDLAAYAAAQKSTLFSRMPKSSSPAGGEAARSEPVMTSAHPATPSEVLQESYTIQVGAFTKLDYAQRLVTRLRKRGYNAYLLTCQPNGELFHQVRVGNYAQRQFAEEIGSSSKKRKTCPH